MCIAVFLWKAHPLYPFLLLLNRDEYHSRPTKPLDWWKGDKILGGRDELGGGTWLGSSRGGKVAFITNVRELQSIPQAKSRGDLPVRFLEGTRSPQEFAEEIAKEAYLYNGFNLILADIRSDCMIYVTNRPKEENGFITEVSPGIHVLSNAKLDTPWPKAERLSHGFQDLLALYADREVPVDVMVENLMTNTVKDDLSVLPNIYPPEREYHLSSIFIDMETPLGRYGTRSTSALYFKACGDVSFHERYLDDQLWRQHTITYQIIK